MNEKNLNDAVESDIPVEEYDFRSNAGFFDPDEFDPDEETRFHELMCMMF